MASIYQTLLFGYMKTEESRHVGGSSMEVTACVIRLSVSAKLR